MNQTMNQTRICCVCGKPFVGVRNVKCCSEACSKIRFEERRASYNTKKRQVIKAINKKSLTEICNEAKKVGLTYGQYVLQQYTKACY